MGAISDDDALQIALRLKALADPARVKIVSLLFGAPEDGLNSGQLAAAIAVGTPRSATT